MKPLQVLEGAYIQKENDKLTHISFLKEGKASYVLPNYKNRDYININVGEHFGLMDIAFRFALQQSKQDAKEKRRAKKHQ